uniref:Sidekick cell adhesion molecule 1 n=1 Tax=Amazona collaria TaxID=241587 RepID=A0A8B9F4D2_9PSIT
CKRDISASVRGGGGRYDRLRFSVPPAERESSSDIAAGLGRRGGMTIKLNFCFIFCRGWWAFLLLQLHMLQALAQDDVAPYFKTEPGLPQIHLEGNRLVLTCLAEGSWPLEFKWLRNDSEITAYSSEYKYIIPALQRSDAGFYQCIVRNRMGALLQRRSEVQVAYMGNFMDTNQRKTVTEGQAAVLNLLHILSYPRPQVTWFRDGHKIIPSSRAAITLQNQLVILATSVSDAGSYYVQAVNEKNGENKTSPFINLSATDASDTVAPVIVIPPQNTSIIAGSSEVTLECVANARPLERLSITWKRNGIKITSGISSFGRRLTITNPTSADVGVYFCEAKLRDSTEEPARARAFLSIMEPPYFTAEPNSIILAEAEKDVDILCQAMGIPIPTLVWYKDSVPLSKLENPRYKVLLSGGLRIHKLHPQDAGIFQCFASNKAGEIQTYTYLDVTNIKPAFIQPPEDTTVTEGMTAVLACEVSGAPKPAISWKKGSQILASGSVQIPRFILLESGGLQITPVFLQDAGNYTCCAVNSEGALNAFVMLTVWNRTVIVHPPEDSTVIKGTTATLRCEATHDPRISIRYLWKKDSVVINPSSTSRITVEKDGTLLISQTWSGDIGDYTCEVISFGGNDSGMARLEVIELPHSPQNLLATLNSSYSRSVMLSWVRPFDGNSPVLYYMVELSENNSPWKVHLSNLDPKMTGVTVSGLTPARTYQFRVCAVNQVGKGQYSSETSRLMLPEEPPSAPPKNIVASGRTNQSIMVQWQPPSESEHNGVGVLGDEEEWVSLREVENEPDAQMLEVPNLTPYTHYRFRMRQVNVVGPSPLSQPSRVIQTLQAPPDVAPGSVTARTASETSLRLRWVPLPDTQYNGNPESVGYRIKFWRVDVQSPALMKVVNDRLERECTIEDLEEWTEYELQIQAFNAIGAGPWSEVVRGRTRESVPSAPPENVSAEAVSSTQILLTWTAVPEPEQNGLILGYKILFKAKDLDSEPKSQVVRGNHTQSFLLSGLRKYVLYEIQVLAFTRIGDGVPSSPAVIERTKDDAPGPPVRLVFPEVRLTSVRIIWQPPEEPNGIILGYQIAYRLASSSPNKFTTVEVGSTVRQFTATDLTPESAYIFRTSAKTRQGWGEPLEATVITTEKRERPAPPRQVMTPQSDVTSRSLLLTWVPGSDGSSPIRYFTVQVRELPNGDWQTYSSSISHEATSCIIESLNPFTSYKLRVKATNDIGDSDFSAETEAVTTLQDVPAEPPSSVLVTPHTTSSVLVQWQPPKVESLNGLLLGYRIYYRELDYDTGSGAETKTIQSPSALRAELTRKMVICCYLKKYKRYEVLMTAYNIIGESPTSTPVEVFVGEAAPALAPQNIQINSLSASQLELTWDPPPADSQNGNIQGYKIYYWESDTQNDTEKVKVLFLPETTVRLKNLTSHTRYMVCISAFNAAGDGPRSSPSQGRTHQAAPSAPSFLTFSEITCTTLNVSWGEPTAANGVLQGYRVVYEPLAPIQGVSKVVTVDIKGNWQRWLKVRDLTKGMTYLFKVQARTIAYGPELQANITAGPAEGSPGSPQEILVTKSASGLTLQWTEGDSGEKPTTGYIIEARPSDEGLWDMFVKDIPRSATSYTVDLDKLRQGVTYEFRVVAVNEFGYGEPSVPSVAVSAQTEAPFYEEWWFLLVMALSSLILILLVVFALVLHGQSKKYKNCSAGKTISNVEESVTLDNGGFTALELNSRHLIKSTFSKKNGTRSPPRPSPGGLHYSDEDICNKYNGAVLTEGLGLNEKPLEVSESEATDSDYEDELPKHSFVNHYMSDPTYYNSWKRQQKGVKHPASYRYEECAASETEPYFQTVITTQSSGGVYTPTGQPAPGSRTPVTGFSSFV